MYCNLQSQQSEQPDTNLSHEEIFVRVLLLGVALLGVELGVPWHQISEAVDHFATVINIGTQTAPLDTQCQIGTIMASHHQIC